MKKTCFVSMLALAFMLGIATPVLSMMNSHSVSALANSESVDGGVSTHADGDAAASEVVEVSNETELNAAIKGEKTTVTIKLANDIEIATKAQSIVGPRTVTIDLNGHNITSILDNDIFNVWGANVTFTGTGTISASGATSYGVIAIYDGTAYGSGTNNVTINPGVTINAAGNKYAITIIKQTAAEGNYSTTLNFNGKITGTHGITINGTIQDASKAPTITIGDSASINTSAAAIYAAGVGTWNIGSATITGDTPIATKAGSFTINGAKITATGDYQPNPESEGNGINTAGVVFQIEHNQSYADNVAINIKGGTYTSNNGDIFYEYGKTTSQTPADINISGGTFTAATDRAIFGGTADKQKISISGGTFRGTDVTDFVKNNYLVEGFAINADGTVVSASQSSSSSSSNNLMTYTSADGKISVTGKFSGKVTVDAVITERKVSLFGDRKYTLYNIKLLDTANKEITITEPVTVTMKVPTELDGTKSSIYYVRPDLNGIERLTSSFSNGAITFTTSHFSYYAIVEDNGQLVHGAIDNTNPSGIQNAPSTGAIASRGVIGAVATILPFVALGGLAILIYSRIMIRLRRAEIKAEIEIETANQIISEPLHTTPEVPVDNFLATPMTKTDEDEIRSHIFGQHEDK